MPKIKTTQKVVPKIYCYTTPEIKRHDGWVKIGYTEQDTVERVKQQSNTSDTKTVIEWSMNALYEDSGEPFTDSDFHAYLQSLGIKRLRNDNGKLTEWFMIAPDDARRELINFRMNKALVNKDTVIQYRLRDEQENTVNQSIAYFNDHPKSEILWNAKPRFGKTLTAYDFCMRTKAEKVLIVTNRPAIATSWFADYKKFVGKENGYIFVSEVSSLKGRPDVYSRNDYAEMIVKQEYNLIEFVSLQDLKGSIYFGGSFRKLEEVKNLVWDVLIIDEAHEGIDTYKTDAAFDQITRKHTIHLSGTPFKALANEKFEEQAICCNWTYADEQKAKRNWDYSRGDNPYANLPMLNLYTYQMSEIIKEHLDQGIEIQGETEEYAFDLNEFFSTKTVNNKPVFIHEEAVDTFLDAMTSQEKFPFSTDELRNELRHTFWLLNRIDSCKALANKLQNHNVFKDYKIVHAYGNGNDEERMTISSFNAVKQAIANSDKTITLSVGQLTTGVTIPEWTAVLMLSSLRSPSLYMQAAFRAQNPCLFQYGDSKFRKENAYVFDFDPARTLILFEEFANDLSIDTSAGKGDMDTRKEHVRELLNFFPVIGEDEEGRMVELDAEKVLSIPRKIRSREVVRRGFMSDFLFQNISNVFHAPVEVLDMIKKFDPVSAKDAKLDIDGNTSSELNINDDGDVEIPQDMVIGVTQDVFGEKIYDIKEELVDTVEEITKEIEEKNKKSEEDIELEALKKLFSDQVTEPLIEKAKEKYGRDLKQSTRKALEKRIRDNAERQVERAYNKQRISINTIRDEYDQLMNEATSEKESNELMAAMLEEITSAADKFKEEMNRDIDDVIKDSAKEIVKTVETEKKETKKRGIEEGIKAHLRGFSRTIPSFLMAYGNEDVTLETFDKIIPDVVFKEVTSISIEDFRFLRDGGDYTDRETGEIKHFDGHLFDPVVFDDSIKEFMSLKKKLADYFIEDQTEDIFDYIPPQKTNQIYTPKWVVKKMVDQLEEENPGCFDNDESTFADLYMKSGLYVAEIVKRLYRSEEMKKRHPDEGERLNHIFAKQVYGLAPTEIIYRIALSFVLGFSDEIKISKHNLKLCDALIYAKEGTLNEKLDELYGGN